MRDDGRDWFGQTSFKAFASRVTKRLGESLPGAELHGQMAPSHREAIDISVARTRPHKEGAVLILLFPSKAGVSTVYTIRRADLRHHGGQISFPGGRREPGESLETTALREAEEEVGINPAAIEVLGALTPLYIPPSRFIVHPFVASIEAPPQFRVEEREVERLLEVPIDTLLDPIVRRQERWDVGGEASDIPCYLIEDLRIWGATAMITSELLAVVS